MSSINRSLKKTAERIIRQVLRVRAGETILVLTNPDQELQKISMALVTASHNAGARPNLVFQDPKTPEDFMEPQVLEAFKRKPNIFIGVSQRSTGADAEGAKKPYPGVSGHLARHDIRFFLFEKKYMRGFWTSGLRARDFVRLNDIDHQELGRLGRRLFNRLKPARKIIIKTGSDDRLEIDISKFNPICDDAQYQRPGQYGNLPCGEVFYSPVPGRARGSILLDGVLTTVAGTIRPREPVRVIFEQGRVSAIEGREAADKLRANFQEIDARIKKMVAQGKINRSQGKEYCRNITALGEVGIGINRQARIYPGVGLLEAEKVFGSMHIAFGHDYEGKIRALNHQDCVTRRPQAWLVSADGRTEQILADRKFRV